MKVKSLVVAMFLLAGSVNVFAESKVITQKAIKLNTVTKTSCTVTVKTGKYNVSITNTCDCSRKTACDGAYAIASFLL